MCSIFMQVLWDLHFYCALFIELGDKFLRKPENYEVLLDSKKNNPLDILGLQLFDISRVVIKNTVMFPS